MQFETATPEQLDLFVKSAMDRYKELGVPADKAMELMQNEILKAATDIGIIQPPQPEQPTQKTAADEVVNVAIEHLKKTAGMTEEQAVEHLEKYMKKEARVAAFKAEVAQELAKQSNVMAPPQMAAPAPAEVPGTPAPNVLTPHQPTAPTQQKNPVAQTKAPVKPAVPKDTQGTPNTQNAPLTPQ